jgi:sec-independent protein translocase protein TatA
MQTGVLLFLDISGGEFLVILLAVFLIFGPKRMPEIARKIGRVMNELKKASGDITKEFREETNVISREISSARESIRRETENIRKEMPDLASISTEDTSIYPEIIETEVKPEPIAENSSDLDEKPKPLT